MAAIAPLISCEDEDEHCKTVYARFGVAIFCAQCLEHELVNALLCLDLIPNHARSVRSIEQWQCSVDRFMDQEFEKTLGQLIKRLDRVANVPTDLSSKLDKALRLRNWLVHDYFRERAIEWLNRVGRNRMISELETCQQAFQEADNLLDATFKPVREKYGFTDEWLQHAYEEYITEARANLEKQ